MKLLGKFSEIIGFQSTLRDNFEKSKAIHKIADDYAIEFAEWFNRFVQYYDNVNGIRYYTYLHDLEVYTSLQLLQTFKKEKEL